MKLFTLRRLVLSLLLAVAAGSLVYAFVSSNDEEVAELPTGIVRVFPDDGEVALRQDAIGMDLAFGYEGALQLDRTELPADQVAHIEGINRYSYTPGQGTETGALAEGRHCATAVYWHQSETRDDARTFTWCFTAH